MSICEGIGTNKGGSDFSTRIAAACAVAAKFAEAVDRDARFPKEAFDELRAQRLLGIILPQAHGGESRGFAEAMQACYALGRACSSTAMIYAMHLSQLACVTYHADKSERYVHYLRRIGDEQMLLASATTEGQAGANVRSSVAAIIRDGDRVSLSRDSSVVSYGAEADVIVATARRSPESLPGDQALALFFKENYRLQRTGRWDVMGMRGTCSDGFQLEAQGESDQVLTEPYDRIHRRTMVPASHLLWTACWAGIAAGSVERAQGFVRKAARGAKGVMPPGAPLATQASLSLMTLVNLVDSAAADYLARFGDESALDQIGFQTSLNLLKVSASQLAIATVMHALNACGLAGYRNDSEFSVARSLRDILSSSIMVNNNRILTNVSPSCLISGVPETITRKI
jgi:acyl-CoA dehydrogenase